MVKAYPDSSANIQSAAEYLKTINEICNYVKAVEQVNLEQHFKRGSVILDLGCGGGWLSAILSNLDSVKTIYALDSSRYFLKKLLPQVISLMQGNAEKLVPIEGFFQPLLLENACLDAVVASSTLHHAENLESLLLEMRRVLKRGGMLFALNETPWPGYRHLVSVAAAAFRILRNLIFKKYYSETPAISSAGYLYDPKLGDRDYPLWYWKKAIRASGFFIESVIDTGLPTIRGSRGRSLIHFVCRAI